MFDPPYFDNQRSAFGDEKIARFLSMFVHELSQRRAALDVAARCGRRKELADHAHAVASVAGSLGFMTLVTIGRRLEEEVAEMPADKLNDALGEFRQAITAATGVAVGLADELADTADAGRHASDT